MPPRTASGRRANGPAIRALREALGIRHGDFARDVSVSTGYLSNIEKGARQPAPDVTRRIATRLGVSLDAITYPVFDDEPVSA
jgi:transcriptional regulator with XRE-family HTH domain